MRILPVLFLIISITLVLAFFVFYVLLFKRHDPIADLREVDTARFSFPLRRYPLEKKDILPLFLIPILYGAVAFYGLGDIKGPESFCSFTEKGRYVVIELEEESSITRLMYYSGLHSGNYFLQYSLDGENYTDEAIMEQSYSDIFKWHEAKLDSLGKGTKFVRIISDDTLNLGEICLYDWEGKPIPVEKLVFDEGAATLFDEQELVPERESYKNSAYFDEIYHVRTAYEHIEDVYPYELSHPPLGKLIISLGIKIFGLAPFGWRFMGVLFGVLMLPFLYVFIKNLFGSTAISVCGTLLFAFDFMHFVQTRIATIDTYAVFFIMLMYLFMYRYVTAERDGFSLGCKGALPLFLSGLSFGLGVACKWTAVYAGLGLALIWLIFRIMRSRQLTAIGRGRLHRKELFLNILLCLFSFVLIPAAVYYLSYYPYGIAKGMDGGVSMLLDADYAKIVLDNQRFMFTYHAGVDASHPYSSAWYQWLVDGRPILYYLRSLPNNYKSAFGAFLNPLVCWGGLLAMLAMVWRSLRHKDSKAMFILIGYLSQLVPWMFISRITFAYHYFPCLIFLVLAICHVFNSIRLRDRRWKIKVYTATALCLLLFIAFYPVLTGVPTPRAYTDLLVWVPGAWPF
ncbi:MAG: phospholipid carrier-dependent glycosyltransferase [Clostridiales bacterium]|nr:phospholipid carrier-dependent glycosyltransferase [Clostridiales bacterium]